MIYTLDEIVRKVTPIAVKYDLPAVYVFGSYARNEATAESDLDILIDSDNSRVKSLFDLGGLYTELSEAMNKKIDLLTVQSLEQQELEGTGRFFIDNIVNEGVMVYERA